MKNDGGEQLMWFFLVLVGLGILLFAGALWMLAWFAISSIGMKLRKDYLASKARERIEERLEREGANVPIDDIFTAYGVAGVVVDDDDLDDDDLLGGILLGMGRSINNG